MAERNLDIFSFEVMHLRDHVLNAINDRNRAVADVDRIWASIEWQLVALVRLTRVFWPIPASTRVEPEVTKARLERGEAMRGMAGIVDARPPKSLLEVRHALEHFDERLDLWWLGSEHQAFADRSIGHPSEFAGIAEEDFARSYDPKTGAVTIFGETVMLGEATRTALDLAEATYEGASDLIKRMFPHP